jgi:hypothetical protein
VPSAPPLRLRDVILRGATYGVVLTALVLAVTVVADGSERLDGLAIVSGVAGITAVCALPLGAFYWWASGTDRRRLREWREVPTGRSGAVHLTGPLFLRLGTTASVLCVGALVLYRLVDQGAL